MAIKKNTIFGFEAWKVVIGIIILIFIVSGGRPLEKLTGEISGADFTITNVDYVTDNVLDKAWNVQARVTGSGQRLIGAFSKENLVSDDGTLRSINGFTLDFTLNKNDVFFIINSDGTSFNRIKSVTDLASEGIKDKTRFAFVCHSYNGIPTTNAFFAHDWRCFLLETAGTLGTINPQAFGDFSVSTKVSSTDGKTASVIVNNNNAGVAEMKTATGENIGTIRWSGTLASADVSAPFPSNTLRGLYTNNWILVHSDRIADARNAIAETSVSSCMNGLSVGENWNTRANSCMTDVNNLVTKALQAANYNPTTLQGQTVPYESQGSVNAGKLVVHMPYLWAVPFLELKIKAAWLGIEELVGMPKIIGAKVSTFQAGGNGIVSITVQNIGQSRGTFIVSASCPSPFTVSPVSTRITVEKGATQIATLGISSSQQGTVRCTATAQDSIKAGNIATLSFDATANTFARCTLGEKVVIANKIVECDGTGFNKIIVECDPNTQLADLATGKCKDLNTFCKVEGQAVSPTLGESCCTDPVKLEPKGGTVGIGATCQEVQDNAILYILIILLAIVVMFSIGLITLSGKKSRPQRYYRRR